MGLLTRLFGKKDNPVPDAPPPKEEPAAREPVKSATADAPPSGRAAAPNNGQSAPPAGVDKQKPVLSEADNLKRWRESGRARAWVEAHRGQWNHGDWLALLEELKRSPYWPLSPDAVGAALEEVKREWLRRN